ncbi:UNVERIFIED_CONTAM: hypothetical protein Slati_4222900 [Sesamum latifolium]|uniref:Retrotransposon gag domain-containing protein n=1 Tax=Sesamum latifolium TaxID=2727402 RepID=A0AAW2TB12_9LAMI
MKGSPSIQVSLINHSTREGEEFRQVEVAGGRSSPLLHRLICRTAITILRRAAAAIAWIGLGTSMGPRRGAVTRSSSSAANMVGQKPESPRRATSPSGQAAIPEEETSRSAETVMSLKVKVFALEAEIIGLNSELEDCRQVIQEWAGAFRGGGIADMRRDMEQMLIQIGLLQRAYFLAANVEDEARKVSTATMYLTGDAKLWWRTKYSEIQANQVRLDTWALLWEAIRVQFFPENVEYNARWAFRRLGAKSFRSNSNRGGGDRKPHAQTGSQGSSSRNKPQENRPASQRSTGCFLCYRPHRYRDCSKKQLLNALVTFTNKASPAKQVEPQASVSGRNDPKEDKDNLDAISQWCNTLSHQVEAKKMMPSRVGKTAPALTGSHPEDEAKPRNPRKNGLMFVDVKIHGKPIRAMIDTGATHNYLASAEVERLGLVLEKGVGRVKAINSAAQLIAGVAKSVLIKVGAYECKTNLSVVVMDDFELILGLDFLRDTHAAVLPHVDSLMMMGTKPCVIPTLAGWTREKNLSAM